MYTYRMITGFVHDDQQLAIPQVSHGHDMRTTVAEVIHSLSGHLTTLTYS
jgi:hypothetical protein